MLNVARLCPADRRRQPRGACAKEECKSFPDQAPFIVILGIALISSLSIWAKASTITWRLAVCHSSLRSNSTEPISRMLKGSMAKIPTASPRRVTALFRRLIGFVL